MHLFTSAHLELVCPACRKKHNNSWKSQFDPSKPNSHFRTKKCEHCDYEIYEETREMSAGKY